MGGGASPLSLSEGRGRGEWRTPSVGALLTFSSSYDADRCTGVRPAFADGAIRTD